jgi:hypothetical protein
MMMTVIAFAPSVGWVMALMQEPHGSLNCCCLSGDKNAILL